MIRFFLILFLLLSVLPLQAEVARPNVIFMMADDMGMGDTSAYQDITGNADTVQVYTPNMERLARMGVRFTDAHTPSSRCSPTRYGLLTGRYPWRNRLKHWVLFGSQGDPMIEKDRPTLATLFEEAGYGTAIVGKWHIGLRYCREDGSLASGWTDADITKPLFDSPMDHGFSFARYTSRSHATSAPRLMPGGRKGNGPEQMGGPGHLHDRVSVSVSGNGRELVSTGENAYVLSELGGRHSDLSLAYLSSHLSGNPNAGTPFFLYYPSPSNHSPYTPDTDINGKQSKGASKTVSGELMDLRHDFIHENDLILGRFLDFLEENEDSRYPGKKLIDTTIVVFTSDNGAEKDTRAATGPFRSNKGSIYEGGHRVPFLVSWGVGKIGDGNSETAGSTNDSVICLTDMFATFADVLGVPLPDLRNGGKGAEDSFSVLEAWQGGTLKNRFPFFAHDHKQAESDPAMSAIRVDSPRVNGEVVEGKWKLFFDATLLRQGTPNPVELYDLSSDQEEENNRVNDPALKSLVAHLSEEARLHRNSGGHRYVSDDMGKVVQFSFRGNGHIPDFVEKDGVALQLIPSSGQLDANDRGVGVSGGKRKQVDSGETLTLKFDRDVIVEHLAIVAGNGTCGGFYQVGDKSPLAIYCVDGDVDEKDQSGVLSDIGLVRTGEALVLSSAPHYGVESPGAWRLQSASIRLLK